jgi:peptidyl-prolyl cis-trans isomerase SurA
MERRQSSWASANSAKWCNLLKEKKLDEAYVRWAQEVRGRAYVELREPPQ